MLNFFTDLLEDFVKEDGLAILGEGLGLMKLVAGVEKKGALSRVGKINS